MTNNFIYLFICFPHPRTFFITFKESVRKRGIEREKNIYAREKH